MNVTVELDIFSGSPNPTWTLTQQESIHLVHLMDSLPEKEKNEFGDGLGYRGFILTITPANTQAAPYRVQIFNGTILIDADTKKYFHDLQGLEKWLLEQASGKGYNL